MKFHATPIAGLWEIETLPRGDARGSLTRLHCVDAMRTIVPDLRFVQSNLSVTAARGTVRGMHFQRAPALEAKLIRCLRGRVFDVAVDLRDGSPTFGRWHAVELGAENQRQVLIPAGCAHGFQALEDRCELLYQHTAPYMPDCEDGVRHDDPRLAIRWPLPVVGVSARDLAFLPLDAAFEKVPA
jgi:dTDP-4-dehydrorhamnose 3,5-epimerase